MRRQICWTERMEDGVKRETRVTFHGGGLKWQFKRADRAEWDYDSPPTAEDWADLEERVEGRYRRKRAPLKDLELVRKLRQQASA